MLEWNFIEEQMTNPKIYWLSTTTLARNPHAIPIWGAWYSSKFYFGGGPDTKNRKNLSNNPHIVVHTESGTKVVIIEGIASLEKDSQVNKKIIEIYKEKYEMDHPAPFWRVDPKKIFAWNSEEFVHSPTKWVLEQ